MNRLRLFDAAHITAEMHQQMSRTFVFVGDVLLNITGASIGRVAWVKNLDCEANVNQHVCIIRPDTEKVDSSFLSACLSLPAMQSHINGIQIGASRQALNHVQVRNMSLPLPPLPLQRDFARKVDQVDLILSNGESTNAQIEDTWSSILRRAFSGQLTAKWREAHMKELLAEMEVQARQLNLPMPQEAAV